MRGFVATSLGQAHYQRLGRGPALVLIHRTADSITQFDDVIECLATRFDTIALDTPGFGESAPLSGPPGIAAYARAVVDAVDELGVGPFFLLGHRTGASIAVEVAATFHDRVDKLVLSGCPEFTEGERTNPRTRRNRPARGTLEHYVDTWKIAKINLGPWATPYQVTRSALDSLRAAHDHNWAYDAVYTQNIQARLGAVTAPTLFLYGEDDPFRKWLPTLQAARAGKTEEGRATKDDRQRGADVQPSTFNVQPHHTESFARFIPGANALTMLHKPAEFCAAVTEFLLGSP